MYVSWYNSTYINLINKKTPQPWDEYIFRGATQINYSYYKQSSLVAISGSPVELLVHNSRAEH